MTSKELSEFYERRLGTILKQHKKLIDNAEGMSKEDKERQYQILNAMLDIVSGKEVER